MSGIENITWLFYDCTYDYCFVNMEFYDPRHSTYNVQLNSITAIDPDGILTEGPAAVDRYGFVGNHKQASWVFLHLLSTGNAALLKYC